MKAVALEAKSPRTRAADRRILLDVLLGWCRCVGEGAGVSQIRCKRGSI